MKRSPDTIYEDQAICLPCWSAHRQETPRVRQNETIPSAKDKKISLKKQPPAQRYSHCQMPIRDVPVEEHISKTARASAHPETTWNYHEPAHHQYQHHTTERASHPAHQRTPPIIYQETSQKEGPNNPSNCLLLTQTTKLQKSIPILNEELIKTRKMIPQIRKGSTSLLHGRESVCSFTENYDPVQRIEESQVLQDYFNPSESQLNQIKILYRMGQSRKSSVSFFE